MKQEDKLDEAVRLLREWQNEDTNRRAVVLCSADIDTGTVDFFRGNYLLTGSALYALYQNNAFIRKIVTDVLKVYQTCHRKENGAEECTGQESEPRQIGTALYVENNEGILNIR